MSNCAECSTADIYCAFDSQFLCEAHSVDHIGPPHSLLSKKVENLNQIREINQKELKKHRKDLENLEKESFHNNLRPFLIENGEKVYLNKAEKKDLNTNVIPVIIDGFIWLVDVKKKCFKIIQKDLAKRVGFTMNVFNNRLILTGGRIFDRYLYNVDDLFDQKFQLMLTNPRFFHSAVIHNNILYVIGGLMKYKSYYTIEGLVLDEDQTDQIVFYISCKMVSPLSFLQHDSIFTFFLEPSENKLKVMIFNIDSNTKTIKSLKSIEENKETKSFFKSFVIRFKNFWTSSSMVFINSRDSSQIFVYLPSEQQIINIKNTIERFSIEKADEF